MRLLKKLFQFYIESSIHVSLAVVALSGVTLLHFNLSINPDLLLLIFFGTIVGYNFVKYAGVANLHHISRTRNLQAIRIFSVGCLIGLIYFALQLPLPVLLTGGIFCSLTILYALPIFKNTNLRSLKGTKIFVIALVWAGTTVIVPLVEAQYMPFPDTAIEFIQRFLFVIVLMLPFEIRDLKFDLAELATIPQIFGISKTRWIGAGILLMILLLEFVKTGSNITAAGVLLGIVVITGFLLFKSEINQPKYYSAFWVEGIPIVWWGVLWISVAFI